MTEQHRHQLREAFETHENLTPDPAAVYAKVQELSKKYKRRRLGAQVAGGAVLSAGLVAGVVNLPAFLPAGPDSPGNGTIPAAAPAVSPSAKPAVSLPAPPAATLERQRLDAYFDAGYGYAEAVELAKLWKLGDDPYKAKAEGGRRLLLGETLPVAAGSVEEPPVDENPISATDQKRLDAFFGAGYTWTEAEKLAKIWKMADPSDAKIEAGKRILARQDLPIKPRPANVEEQKNEKRVAAFFRAGYDVDDAIRLAKLWKTADAYAAKVEGGKRLIAGQTLPFRP